MPMRDDLGDRMKGYESAEAGRRLMPRLPVMARIDGRSFSTFTRDLERPFDPRFGRLMVETTRALVRETGARVGYTQSDEITLVLYADGTDGGVWFDGRIQKITSQLAAQATAFFGHLLAHHLPEKHALLKVSSLPTFDARVWNVPSVEEAVNVFLWRERDAVRNSVLMTAHTELGHTAAHGMDVRALREALRERGVVWEEYPAHFRHGTYLQRRSFRRRFTPVELAALPPKHAAHADPGMEYERAEIVEFDLASLDGVDNRVGLLFHGEDPSTR